jgi:hypothetical protein
VKNTTKQMYQSIFAEWKSTRLWVVVDRWRLAQK